MQRNLMIKTGVIAATILACIFGVIGFPTSLKQAEANAGKNIHLGLDLSGGSYLILDVQVQDVAKRDADALVEGLLAESRTRNIPIGGIDHNDPQTVKDTDTIQVNIHGVDATKSREFRTMVA